MGKITLKTKCYTIMAVIAFIFLLLVSYIIFFINSTENDEFDYRTARVQVNRFILNLENILNSEQMKSGYNFNKLNELNHYKMNYILVDLKGTVIWNSGETQYKTGDSFPLRTLSGIRNESSDGGIYNYIAPIFINDTQQYTVVLTVPTKDFQSHSHNNILLFIPVIILAILMLCLLIGFIKLLRHSIFEPISELHKATNSILMGDLQKPLTYDYDDEPGELCHDFEMMRSELLSASEQAKKLKENEKLLLACISHDLKTPLSSISGYVEGIKEGLVKDEEGIRRYSNIVMDKVTVLSKLIDDILEHSKTELNEFSIETEETYSKMYFTDIFDDVSNDVIRSGLKFRIEEIPDYIVNIDLKRIRQVVYNIISNSLKFTQPGGEIYVSFFTNHGYNGDELVVSIKDTGKGISASDLPFIFDKFYRGEKARTLNIAGSGLGLSIAKYIIEKHGGNIECDSVLDVGTTIMFSLPL